MKFLGILVLIALGYGVYEFNEFMRAKHLELQNSQQIEAPPGMMEVKKDQIAVERMQQTFNTPLNPADKRYAKYRNYFIEQVRKGEVYRWSKRNLSYYVDKNARRRIKMGLVRKVFSHWSKKSRIFRFREVPTPGQADIYINLSTTENQGALGEAGPDQIVYGQVLNIGGKRVQEYIIKHANVTLSEEHFSFENVKKFRKNNVTYRFNTFSHEMGHVLGLMIHSPHQGDCMYYQSDRHGKACDNMRADTNTLAMLYGLPSLLNRGFHDNKVAVRY